MSFRLEDKGDWTLDPLKEDILRVPQGPGPVQMRLGAARFLARPVRTLNDMKEFYVAFGVW